MVLYSERQYRVSFAYTIGALALPQGVRQAHEHTGRSTPMGNETATPTVSAVAPAPSAAPGEPGAA